MPTSKQELIPHARAMYALGQSCEEIAQALNVSAQTIYRWKKADRVAGVDWDAARDHRRRMVPRAILSILEDMYARLCEDCAGKDGKAVPTSAQTDSIQKLSNVIHRERERLGDISTVLGVLGGFAEWAAENCNVEERAMLLRVHEAYLLDLKRKATP